MNSEFIEIPVFWSQTIKPGEPVSVCFPDDAMLTITSACIPNPTSNSITRLKSHVESLIFKSDEDVKSITSDLLIATFIPNVKEFQNLALVYSPLNMIELCADGPDEVHLVGHLTPFVDDSDALFEEEEEE
ncbi:hypothetical protein GPJ56_002114 [Histomonas meleagridis]|uniref:uncharacterized protein n=1 Tax=Histomonas meleagridis TaxID=135588 RepID=UPI00355A7461|nr:hypothetical protein GPJ56_002114 [Histomonas meleagridis]KAH0806709.1 hypothetical protein GO595_000560 [Histomonas meleagridis]